MLERALSVDLDHRDVVLVVLVQLARPADVHLAELEGDLPAESEDDCLRLLAQGASVAGVEDDLAHQPCFLRRFQPLTRATGGWPSGPPTRYALSASRAMYGAWTRHLRPFTTTAATAIWGSSAGANPTNHE